MAEESRERARIRVLSSGSLKAVFSLFLGFSASASCGPPFQPALQNRRRGSMPIEKLRRLSERLGGMDGKELLARGRQALAIRSDAALGWLGYDFAQDVQTVTASVPANFFFAPDNVDSLLALLKRRLPERPEQIIQEAEQILKYRFDLLGYKGLHYGRPINWHLDEVHQKRAPKKASYRIRYLDYDECGDSKITWELNRHQHLVTLAKASRLTHDRRYVDEILQQRRHWQAENPYLVGINWVSSLEVAFRSLSWLWTYHLLQSSAGFSDLRSEWLRDLALHGRHIERNLSTYFSPNTHLLGEGVALFFLGVLCPELKAAGRWMSLGWEIVLRESGRQVRSDGFHFEQSTYYHVYAVDLFLHAALLARVNNIPTPKSLEDTIEKMLTALCLLGRSGPPPQFGDDDGGRLFDPRRNRSEHLLDPLAVGAVLFHRGDFKAVAGQLREETLWLLGQEGVRQWDELEGTAVVHKSAALPESGYYMLATGHTQLIVDAGPLGAQRGGHGHADALGVCLQSRGHSLLIDSGTFEYVGPGRDRDLFRGTGSHNTLRVDGLSQAESQTPFSWRRLTQSTVEQWVQGQTFDLLVASHDGFQRLKQPVTHRRWAISLKNGVYLVRDVVEGSGEHRIDIAWHLDKDVELLQDGLFRVKGGALGLAFLTVPNRAIELQTKMCSPAYGYRVPITALNVCADVTLPAEFAVLLITLEEARPIVDSFNRVEHTPNIGVSHYEYKTGIGEYSFFFNERGGTWRAGSLSSDAKYVCRQRGPGASEEHLSFVCGSYASVEGGAGLRSSRQVAWAELVVAGHERKVSSSDGTVVLVRTVPESASDPAISGEV